MWWTRANAMILPVKNIVQKKRINFDYPQNRATKKIKNKAEKFELQAESPRVNKRLKM